MQNEETFFPRHRRESIICGATILETISGEKRLKLQLKIPLTGESLVGMPSWIGEPFTLMAKPEFGGKHWVSDVSLDPMILRVYALPQTEQEVISIHSVRMTHFRIEHDSEDEHPNLILTCSAYVAGRIDKVLKFAEQYFGSSVYVKYEAAQPSLLDQNPNIQAATEPYPRGDDGPIDDEEEEEDAPAEDDQDEVEETTEEPPVIREPEPSERALKASSPQRRPLKTTSQPLPLQ